MRTKLFITLGVLGICQLLQGQNMHVSWYSVANGLPSNEVRHVAHDSLGYAWIATDAGLVRFDGNRFDNYSQYIPSQYAKYFLSTPQGLLLSHDAGIGLIASQLDTVIISEYRNASIMPGDSLLYYPNRIFKRNNGDILVAQAGGRVHRITPEGIQKLIPASGESSDRGMSQYFTEVANQLWIAHEDGSLFRYNEQSGKLEKKASFPGIYDMKSNGTDLWIGSDNVYRIQLSADGLQIDAREPFLSTPGQVTALILDKKHNLYLGVRDLGLYYLDRTGDKKPEFIKVYGNNDPHTLDELPFKNIHNIVSDSSDRLWICSSEGLGILQKRFFESIGSIPNANATAISIADNGSVFVNFGDLYRVEKTDYGYEGEQLPTSSLGTITALTTKGDRLWTGTSIGKLHELNQRGSLIRTVNLEDRGEGIFYLMSDSRNRLWVAQAPRDQPLVGIGCLLPDGTLREYGKEDGLEDRIICVRETSKKRIYASGMGLETYLYRYMPEKDSFVNLSLPFDFYVGPNFQVHDLAIDEKGIIWLASTDGLLRHDMERVSKVDLGPLYNNEEVKAVTTSADGSIWISFDTEGVLRYTEDNSIIIQEESGLPSIVMTYRCIQSDKDGRLWIGTAEGVVYSLNSTPQPARSDPPLLISTKVEGETIAEGSIQIYPDEEVQLNFNAPSFHGYRTFYQHRIDEGSWSPPDTKTSLILSGLDPGPHTLNIRSQKEGAFLWSTPQAIQIAVKEYWYKNRILLWLGSILLIAAVIFVFWTQKRRFQLMLSNLNQGLVEKQEEVSKQEEDLSRVKEEMKLRLREHKANLLVLEIMHRLISKIGPSTKWEMVLEAISMDLLKLPGVVAFEIGVHRGKNIEFEGYSESVRGFTSAKVPFDQGSCLAAYCISQAKACIFNRLTEENETLLDKKDSRITSYKSALSVPFYIDNYEAILTVYAKKEDLFDEYTRKAFQIFATYLEQIV